MVVVVIFFPYICQILLLKKYELWTFQGVTPIGGFQNLELEGIPHLLLHAVIITQTNQLQDLQSS